MPYKSKAQMKKFFAMEKRGEIAKGTAEKWAKHTPNIKSLPERIGKKKMSKHIKRSMKKAAFKKKK